MAGSENSSKEDSKGDTGWRVEEPDEAKYNFSDEKGLWQPKPDDILSMFEKLAQGGVLPLKWSCPGRRPPDKLIKQEEDMEEGMEEDGDESKEEESRMPETSAFDFDEMQTDVSAKLTPRVTPGGVGRTPRTEKRVARMDNIMDSLRKQQIQRVAEREARKATKGSPLGMNTTKKRLLNFDSPGPKSMTGGSKSSSNSPARVASPSRAMASGISETPAGNDNSNSSGKSSMQDTTRANSPSQTQTPEVKPSKSPASASDVREKLDKAEIPGSSIIQNKSEPNLDVSSRESDSNTTAQFTASSKATNDIPPTSASATLPVKLEPKDNKNSTSTNTANAPSSNLAPTTTSSSSHSDAQQTLMTTSSENLDSVKEVTAKIESSSPTPTAAVSEPNQPPSKPPPPSTESYSTTSAQTPESNTASDKPKHESAQSEAPPPPPPTATTTSATATVSETTAATATANTAEKGPKSTDAVNDSIKIPSDEHAKKVDTPELAKDSGNVDTKNEKNNSS